jgi:hypothetical protein
VPLTASSRRKDGRPDRRGDDAPVGSVALDGSPAAAAARRWRVITAAPASCGPPPAAGARDVTAGVHERWPAAGCGSSGGRALLPEGPRPTVAPRARPAGTTGRPWPPGTGARTPRRTRYCRNPRSARTRPPARHSCRAPPMSALPDSGMEESVYGSGPPPRAESRRPARPNGPSEPFPSPFRLPAAGAGLLAPRAPGVCAGRSAGTASAAPQEGARRRDPA